MKFPRPPSESQPRPHKAVDVLQAFETEPESDIMFDPKVDIGQKDEQAMFDMVGEYRKKKLWNLFYSIAMELSMLFPERRAEFELNDDEFREVSDLFNGKMKDKNKFESYLNAVVSFAILYPERKSDFDINRQFKKIMKLLDVYRRDENWLMFGKTMFFFSILFPDKRGEIQLSDAMFDDVKEELKWWRDRKDYLASIDIVSFFSILYPDRKAEFEVGEFEFDQVKKVLMSKKFKSSCHVAWRLMILAADRAEITSDGQIKLSYKPKALVKPRRPLPTISKV